MAGQSTSNHKHIWVITGPAGCGKTSVAQYLHDTLSIPYLEGDKFHTPENIEKMANDHPLTDADRWDWLIELREQAVSHLAGSSTTTTTTSSSSSPSSNTQSNGVIVTCSALKRKYRDVIRVAAYHDATVRVHFVFLSVSETALMDRVRARKNHYMKDSMVKSQVESLETPQADEVDVLSVDANGTSAEVQRLALAVVNKVLNADVG